MSEIATPIVTRFAPSPTGFLHVGGARTALYNWMFARRHAGRFILRIEDTDQSRHVARAEQAIFEALTWLGILWDEGPPGSHPGLPSHGGPSGPYRQSERLDLYRAAFDKLLAEELAYRDFTSPAELDTLRRDAERRKVPFVFRPGPLPQARQQALLTEGTPHVLRLRMPGRDITVSDLIRGQVTYPGDTLDDFVIRKSDGWPTYHMGVVVDDALMGITHVIRAAEHLANTPRHMALQAALGYATPVYAHIPVVLNANGSKMSKRNRGSKVEDYRAAGYLPAALLNYMALVGWSPGSDRELMTLDEMVAAFDLDRINKSNGRWDLRKCLHFNKEYILRRMERSDLKAAVMDWLSTEVDRWLGSFTTRMETIEDFVRTASPLWVGEVVYDPRAWASHMGQPQQVAVVAELGRALAGLAIWEARPLETALHEFAAHRGGLGQMGQSLRVALTGRAISPPLHETLALLGRDESLRRLVAAVEFAGRQPGASVAPEPLITAANLARSAKLFEEGLRITEAALSDLAAATPATLRLLTALRGRLLADLERFDEAAKVAAELAKSAETAADPAALLAAAMILRQAAEDHDDIKRRYKAYEPVITAANKAIEIAGGPANPHGLAGVVLKAFGLHRIGKEEPALKALAPAAETLAARDRVIPGDPAAWAALLTDFGPRDDGVPHPAQTETAAAPSEG